MSENQRNIIVAVFVIFGLVVLGWLVFQFGDLHFCQPLRCSRNQYLSTGSPGTSGKYTR